MLCMRVGSSESLTHGGGVKEKLEWGIKNDFVVFDERRKKVYLKEYQYVG